MSRTRPGDESHQNAPQCDAIATYGNGAQYRRPAPEREMFFERRLSRARLICHMADVISITLLTSQYLSDNHVARMPHESSSVRPGSASFWQLARIFRRLSGAKIHVTAQVGHGRSSRAPGVARGVA